MEQNKEQTKIHFGSVQNAYHVIVVMATKLTFDSCTRTIVVCKCHESVIVSTKTKPHYVNKHANAK